MTARRRTLRGSGLIVAGLVGLAAVVIALVVLSDSGVDVEPEPPRAERQPEPEPEPEPPPPVDGEVELAEVADLSITGSDLVAAGSSDDEPVDVNDDAVDALVTTIAVWLDDHLTDLQEGGDGLVGEVGLQGPEGAGDLAGPGEVVADADYTFRVGARGTPEWVRVDVEVTTEEGDEHAAVFAFTGHEEPELQGVEART